MDQIYNLIEAANSIISSDKGMLVIHKNMQVHPKFKAYKTFNYSIYLVKNENKELLFHWEVTKNATDSLIEVWRQADKEFLPEYINWLSSKSFIKLKK